MSITRFAPRVERTLPLAQGVYFVATGVWSLIDDRSFQKVTGPKTDVWLVKTVGAIVTAIGVSMISAAARNAVTRETALLGAGTAVSLTAIDATYVAKRRISPVYLLDAFLEVGFALGWVVGLLRNRRARSNTALAEIRASTNERRGKVRSLEPVDTVG